MAQVEILEYIETPGQFQWGFLKVSYNSLILAYQVKGKKDNSGYFITPPSTKCNDVWIEAFTIDSRAEQSKILEMLKGFVDQYYGFAASVKQAPAQSQAPKAASPHHAYQNSAPSRAPGGFIPGRAEDMPF